MRSLLQVHIIIIDRFDHTRTQVETDFWHFFENHIVNPHTSISHRRLQQWWITTTVISNITYRIVTNESMIYLYTHSYARTHAYYIAVHTYTYYKSFVCRRNLIDLRKTFKHPKSYCLYTSMSIIFSTWHCFVIRMSLANKTPHITLVTILMMVDKHTHRLRVPPLNCYVNTSTNFI